MKRPFSSTAHEDMFRARDVDMGEVTNREAVIQIPRAELVAISEAGRRLTASAHSFLTLVDDMNASKQALDDGDKQLRAVIAEFNNVLENSMYTDKSNLCCL
jgi:hypothetical protein